VYEAVGMARVGVGGTAEGRAKLPLQRGGRGARREGPSSTLAGWTAPTRKAASSLDAFGQAVSRLWRDVTAPTADGK
jgi:hypothetical protein